MKQFVAVFILISILLTACSSYNDALNSEAGSTGSKQAEIISEDSAANADGEKTESDSETNAVQRFELSDAFLSLLDDANTAHEAVKIYDGDYEAYTGQYEDPDLDYLAYNHMPSTFPADTTILTLEQVKEDLEIYYKLLRTQYGCYTYFGGDEVFRPAVDAVITDFTAMEVITCGALLDSMEQHFSFVKDAHFNFGGRLMGEYAIPFFFRSESYIKAEQGYKTADGKVVAAVEGYDNLDELFRLSLTKDGELVYYPILLQTFTYDELNGQTVSCSTASLTVIYEDGSTDKLYAAPYKMPSYSSKSANVDVQDENGIPVVKVNRFYYGEGGMQFVNSAADYRDRDIVIMDLRRCNGGTISMASKWFVDYSLQDVWGNSLYLQNGQPDALYNSHKNRADEEFVPMENVLIVLTSKLTASASEGFIDMGYNMENTLFIGENTFGYRTGSLDYWTLPNTGLFMSFGRLLRLYPNEDYFEEYRGFYPDIWVPEAEAEEAVINFIKNNTTAMMVQ